VAAFIASPVYSRVAATVPTRITVGPLVATELGLPCQRMTQMIDIGGRNVHASALMCRQPNGRWEIAPAQSARTPPEQ
jgi:hypothetical protein